VSILGKNWKIKNEDPTKNVIEKLLENRGFKDPDQVEVFLKTSLKKGLHNPFLMKDMDKSVERIKRGIQNKERMMVFGDYDVDGISGTAILVHTLKIMGAKVSYRLPHRVEEGYGLNEKFIHEFADLKVGLTITVDCGISCKDQIDLAKQKGIDVIITDHHSIPDTFPDKAYSVLHPLQEGCAYPFKGLTGAGVAYKLSCALITDQFDAKEREDYMNSLLDLASLGTVADLGPLVGENRIIVKYGLEILQKTKWQGLNFLKEHAGIEPDAKLDINTIGYQLGPRINAAGRIASPYYALQLLLYDKWDEKGKLLADHLEKLNKKRQQMVFEALEELEQHFDDKEEKKKILIAWDEDWHAGILGLLAAKCVDKYASPTIILQDFGEYLVASGRSPESFNMIEALTEHSHLLKNFGGHVQAAGFTIEKDKLEEFVNSMEEYAYQKLLDSKWKPLVEIDCELKEEEIEDRLATFLEEMEPFGVGNQQPIFLIKNLIPNRVKRVGKEQNHLHFEAIGRTKRLPVIGFKMGDHEQYLHENTNIDLVCHLERNEWKGNTKLQLRAIDIKKSE